MEWRVAYDQVETVASLDHAFENMVRVRLQPAGKAAGEVLIRSKDRLGIFQRFCIDLAADEAPAAMARPSIA